MEAEYENIKSYKKSLSQPGDRIGDRADQDQNVLVETKSCCRAVDYSTAKVGDDQGKEYYFVTAPDKDIDFKIFFTGDSRSRIDATRAVSEITRKAFE